MMELEPQSTASTKCHRAKSRALHNNGLFNDAPMEAVIRSTSVLTKDARYGVLERHALLPTAAGTMTELSNALL